MTHYQFQTESRGVPIANEQQKDRTGCKNEKKRIPQAGFVMVGGVSGIAAAVQDNPTTFRIGVDKVKTGCRNRHRL